MANNLGILEVTLAQLGDSTHAINVVGNAAGNARSDYWKNAVVRVTDHEDNVTLEEDDPEQMALFHSRAHMYPWKKYHGLKQVVTHADADTVTNPPATDTTVLYPNFDYTA